MLCTLCEHPVFGVLFDLHDGLCVGAAASVRQLELPGDIHFHSSVSPLGVAGIQCGAPQLACGRLDGHAGRSCVLLFRGCVSSHGAWQAALENARLCQSIVPS